MNQISFDNHTHQDKQAGFTLVEILVTVLILAVGSLGIASLQLAGLKYTSGSYSRTQAVLLADDMANRIKSNRAFALALNANGTFGTSPYTVANFGTTVTSGTDCLLNRCTPADLAEYDLDSWLAEIRRVLPVGEGRIRIIDRDNDATETVERQFNIAIQWRQTANSTSQEGDPDAELQEFTFRISI